ncbi:MAG: DegQ family serine endoprotease [Mesorhizobium sp.]
MSASQILRRHRLAVLLGAALVVSPFLLPAGLRATDAHAKTAVPEPVAGLVAPGGSFAPIVATDKPAVVTITAKVKSQPADNGSPFGNSPFDQYFQQFFGQQGIPMPQPQQPAPQAEVLGSGFIISADGTIVTNNHVVDGGSDIKVTLDDGTELPATVIGSDAKTDMAVLKVKAGKPLPTVQWGDSDKLLVGDQVLAIGNPFGIGTTVTAGIVSARGRDLNNGPYDDFIQIDAPINHGNSGGPLVDVEGKVVGINTAIYSPNGGSVGVGFAVPSDEAQQVVAKLLKNGSIAYGYLGVQIQPVTPDAANAIGLDQARGALVASVTQGSPAAKAGLEPGDVITALGGKDVKDPKDLSRKVADLAPGADETLTVWRKGASTEIPVTIGQNKEDQKTASADENNSESQATEQGLRIPAIGLGLADITPQLRLAMNLPVGERGAIVESVRPGKSAADAGIQPGDVIVSVNQMTVTTAKEVNHAVSQAEKSGRKSVLLLVRRGDAQTFVAVPLGNA